MALEVKEGKIRNFLLMFRHANREQRDSYSRFIHALSVSSLVGALTLPFSDIEVSMWELKVISLLLIGMVLFIHGLIIYK
jgi:hypothetical protein